MISMKIASGLFAFLALILPGSEISENAKSVVKISYDLIYDSEESGNSEIYRLNLESGEKKRLTDYPMTDGYQALSPDGQRIAFYAYYDNGRTWSIHTMNIDGGDRKRLTHLKNARDSSPSWSPDGKTIIFSRSFQGQYQIWRMNVSGGEKRPVRKLSGLDSKFTPDGRIVYSSHWNETGEICIADPDGLNNRQITRNSFKDGHPEVSPDGSRILFYSDRDGNYELYIMNRNGSGIQRLTNHPAHDWNGSWSPDGKWIAFISNRDGDYEIYVIRSDGSGLRKITDNRFADTCPVWVPR